MPDRRRFLHLAVLSAAAVSAGCGTTRHPTATPTLLQEAVLTTPGTVTNPTGTLGGTSFADLADCFSRADLQYYGYQDLVLMTNVGVDPEGAYGGAADRYLAGQTVKGEKWLAPVMVAMREDMDLTKRCPPPPLGVRFYQEVDENQRHVVTDPVTGEQVAGLFNINVAATVHSQSCGQKRYDPLAGWVSYSRYDGENVPEAERRVEGSYDFTRRAERVTGSFSAPRIYAAAATPKTCLNP